jgi:hypothetical protein
MEPAVRGTRTQSGMFLAPDLREKAFLGPSAHHPRCHRPL